MGITASRSSADFSAEREGHLKSSYACRGWRFDRLGSADDVPDQACLFQEREHPVGDIQFPPAVAVAGDSWEGVMVVVPAFAPGEQADPPQVTTVVGCFVGAVAPDVRCGIDGPGDVQHIDQAHEHPPDDVRDSRVQTSDQPTGAKQNDAQSQMPPQESAIEQSQELILQQVGSVGSVKLSPILGPVTGQHPDHMAPPLSIPRGMRIMIVITEAMMLAVGRDPHDWRALSGKRAAQGERPRQEF